MKAFLPLLLLLAALFSSCRKRDLAQDHEVLIGKWQWVFTDGTGSPHHPNGNDYDPIADGREYFIFFSSNGYYDVIDDGILESEGAIVHLSESRVNLNGNGDVIEFQYGVRRDNEISVGDWPIECRSNIFKKVE